MNEDKEFDSCSKTEVDFDESLHIFTKYSEGSIIWAKMAGYPWWPAMIEIDPDLETYFELPDEESMHPSHYHVVYLDTNTTRAWIKSDLLKPFSPQEVELSHKHKKYSKELAAAEANATDALTYPIKERLKLFGFGTRYKGKWRIENFWNKNKDGSDNEVAVSSRKRKKNASLEESDKKERKMKDKNDENAAVSGAKKKKCTGTEIKKKSKHFEVSKFKKELKMSDAPKEESICAQNKIIKKKLIVPLVKNHVTDCDKNQRKINDKEMSDTSLSQDRLNADLIEPQTKTINEKTENTDQEKVKKDNPIVKTKNELKVGKVNKKVFSAPKPVMKEELNIPNQMGDNMESECIKTDSSLKTTKLEKDCPHQDVLSDDDDDLSLNLSQNYDKIKELNPLCDNSFSFDESSDPLDLEE